MIKELHSEHLGTCKMKSMATSIVWWPGVDKQLETVARECIVSAASQKVPPKAPIHLWVYPLSQKLKIFHNLRSILRVTRTTESRMPKRILFGWLPVKKTFQGVKLC